MWHATHRMCSCRFSVTRSLVISTSLMTVLAASSGCMDSGDPAMIILPNSSGTSNASFGVPELLLESRMVDLDQLRILVDVGGQEWPMQRSGDRWSGSFSLPGDGEYALQVTWFQTLAGTEIALARSAPVNINSNSPRDVRVTSYSTAGFDFDGDGRSNLAELQAGTDPTVIDAIAGNILPDPDQTDCRLSNSISAAFPEASVITGPVTNSVTFNLSGETLWDVYEIGVPGTLTVEHTSGPPEDSLSALFDADGNGEIRSIAVSTTSTGRSTISATLASGVYCYLLENVEGSTPESFVGTRISYSFVAAAGAN